MHDKSQKENDEKGKENTEKNNETMPERDGTSEKKEKKTLNESKKVGDPTSNPSKCHFCEREFMSARGLGVHLRRMHNADQEENTEKGKRKKQDQMPLIHVRESKEVEELEIPYVLQPQRITVLDKSVEKESQEIPTGIEKIRKTEKTRDTAKGKTNPLIPLIEKAPAEEKDIEIDMRKRKLLRWTHTDTENLMEKEIELLNQGFKGFVNVEIAKRLDGKYTNLEVKARRQYIGYKRLLEKRMERRIDEENGKERGKDEREKNEKEREIKRMREKELEKAKLIEWQRKRMLIKEKEREIIEKSRSMNEIRAKEKQEKKEEERQKEIAEEEKKCAMRRESENKERERIRKDNEDMNVTITISDDMNETWHTAESEVKEELVEVNEEICSAPILMYPEKEIEEMCERISRKCKKEDKTGISQNPKVRLKLIGLERKKIKEDLANEVVAGSCKVASEWRKSGTIRDRGKV
ncbi:hypothetical protein SNEBB_005018 [Seison nebaliae]|nr:hypothetical protein SNEBB_005018 [Seison nebaliae]